VQGVLGDTSGFIFADYLVLFPKNPGTSTASRATSLVNASFQIYVTHLEEGTTRPVVPSPPPAEWRPLYAERLEKSLAQIPFDSLTRQQEKHSHKHTDASKIADDSKSAL